MKLRALFDRRFEDLHLRSLEFLQRIPEKRLFWKPPADLPGLETCSAGELLVRSAAAVEQTFGGITRRLWDDPFEWTLPEELGDRNAVREYFSVVRRTRLEGFSFFREEEDLYRLIPAPEELSTILEVLLDALDRASHFEGRAHGVAQQFLIIRPNILR